MSKSIKTTMKGTAVAVTALFGSMLMPQAQAAEISISCGAVGIELSLCEQASQAWAEKTGHTVNIVATPNSATDRLIQYQQVLSSKSDKIDVFQIDVIWPGLLGTHFVDLSQYSDGIENEHFQPIVENNTVNGELKAMPWFTDAGVLYYRKDLLEKHNIEVPQTWEELGVAAKTIMDDEVANGNENFRGIVFQAKAYEGLTCNAVEWIDSFGGGAIVDDNGEITINNEKAIAAIDTIAGWMKGVAPQGVLNYDEEGARSVFQSGNAAFMRNWPYAWALANSDDSPVKDKVGVAALPKGGADGKNTGTLGGWQLAVSKYSNNVDVAADLVMYLTSAEVQKQRAIEGAYNPTIAALYQDEEILAENPFFGDLYDTFVNAVARPSKVTGEKYNEVSNKFWNAVHRVLSGESDAASSFSDLEEELKRVKRRGWDS